MKCPLSDLTLYSEDLIALSGGALEGFVGAPAADGRDILAEERAVKLAAIFNGCFYIEIQRHELNAEVIAEPVLLKISERLNLPLIATNDCRFENESMSRPHDTLALVPDINFLMYIDLGIQKSLF